MTLPRRRTVPSRLRSIALPAEHGSWGLVLEPIALGLLVAPSVGGAFLGLTIFATFLLRRPFKVALAGRHRDDSSKSGLAWRFLAFYGVTALAALFVTMAVAGVRPLLPLILASPLALVFLAYDLRNQSRNPAAELAGSVLFAMAAAGIALAGHWPWSPALVLSALLTARAIPSIFYVRSRIRLERGKPHEAWLPAVAHVVALVLVFVAALVDKAPALTVLPFAILLARAVVGLSAYRRATDIRAVGRAEIGYGVMTVLVLALAYWVTGNPDG